MVKKFLLEALVVSCGALREVETTILRAWLKILDPQYQFHITSDQFCLGMAARHGFMMLKVSL